MRDPGRERAKRSGRIRLPACRRAGYESNGRLDLQERRAPSGGAEPQQNSGKNGDKNSAKNDQKGKDDEKDDKDSKDGGEDKEGSMIYLAFAYDGTVPRPPNTLPAVEPAR